MVEEGTKTTQEWAASTLTAKEPTRGERLFDFITYKALNFAGNLGLSLAIVDLFLGSTPDKKNPNKPTSYFAEKINKPWATKSSDWLRKTQESLDNTFGKTAGAVATLNLGGHIAAIFVKKLENNRASLSKRFDGWIDAFTGTKADRAEIDRREARYEIVKNSPIKTWTEVIAGRVSGMVASMALNQIPETIDERMGNAPTQGRYGFRRITGAAGNYVANGITDRKNAALKAQGKPAMSDMAAKRTNYWTELIMFDTWCTAITSTVMEKVIKWSDKKDHTLAETPIAANTTGNAAPKGEVTATTESIAPKDEAAASGATRFYDEQETAEDKKRWGDRNYDPVDEVGVPL
ncbi:MAG: hypothetical protein P8P30_06915 [Rickettsiales bacterium]|nr:hypothetical protein [Rickettsiales bacterium]